MTNCWRSRFVISGSVAVGRASGCAGAHVGLGRGAIARARALGDVEPSKRRFSGIMETGGVLPDLTLSHFPQLLVVQAVGRGDWIRTSDPLRPRRIDRKSTRLNSSHPSISYAVFCLKKKTKKQKPKTL